MVTAGAIAWRKQGRIYVPSGDGFFKTHATRPVPFRLNAEVLRIFFSSRDNDDRMVPSFVDVRIDDPSRVLRVCEEAPIGFGRPGAFDDSGVTIGSVVEHNGGARVFYTGWKRRGSVVGFELSIGVLWWDRKSDRFERLFSGPLIGQDRHHPLLVAGPFVLNEAGLYRMWYCSGTDWRFPAGKSEPIYTPFYAESADGIDWVPRAGPVIRYKYDGEVVSAPWVLKVGNKYRMWYSTRGHETKTAKNYRIGYAESPDGVSWQRQDELAGISTSTEGWDSEMVCYAAIVPHTDRVYMFYSGNAVGRDGIGFAVADALSG